MKKFWNVRGVAAFAAVLVAMTCLSGCGGSGGVNDAELTAPGEYPIVKEKSTLTIFAPKVQYVEDYSTNEFTNWYEEKTNVHIEWQVASGDIAQAKNVMLASGNYPDVMMNCYINRSEQLVYGEQGIFQDLAPLIDAQTVVLKELMEKRPDIRAALTTPEGKIFGLPTIGEVFHAVYPAKMWVYKPWLDKLGIKTPETTEEFYQMLIAFRDKDPNGNGKKDEIPMAGTSTLGTQGIDAYLMNSFIYSNSEHMMVEDGTLVFTANKPEYRDGLRYLHKLFEEGLILKDSLVMDRKALTALGEKPEAPVLGAAPAMWFGMFTVAGGDSGRDKEYVAIPPLQGPNGVRQTPKSNYKYSGESFNITKNCKNPQLAIRWADWFYSMEGTLTSQYGQEGVGWKRAEEGQKGLDGNQAVWQQIQEFGTLQNSVWTNFGLYNSSEYLRLGINAEGSDQLETVLYQTTKENYEPYGADKTPPELFFDQQQSTEFTGLKTQIDAEVTKSFAAFVSGDESLDNDWDAYCERLKTMGLDRYVELYQIVYDANRKS